MRARFLKAAEIEVDDAVAYFDAQREGLGDRFELDLRDAVTFVTAHPLSGTTINDRVRKFGLRTFRYDIIYMVDRDDIVIVAVAHHRRRPGYWRARLVKVR